jgi:hypothetical protein
VQSSCRELFDGFDQLLQSRQAVELPMNVPPLRANSSARATLADPQPRPTFTRENLFVPCFGRALRCKARFCQRSVSHGRYMTFQITKVAVPRQMFADVLSLIARLRAPPEPA